MSGPGSQRQKGDISPGKNSWAQPHFGNAPPVATPDQWPGATQNEAPFLVGADMNSYQASLASAQAHIPQTNVAQARIPRSNIVQATIAQANSYHPRSESSPHRIDPFKPLPEAPSKFDEARRGLRKLFSRREINVSPTTSADGRPHILAKARSLASAQSVDREAHIGHPNEQSPFRSSPIAKVSDEPFYQYRSRSEEPHGNEGMIFSRQASFSPARAGTYSRRHKVEVDAHPKPRVTSQYGVLDEVSVQSAHKTDEASTAEQPRDDDPLRVTNVWAHNPQVSITMPPFSAHTLPSRSSVYSARPTKNNNSFAGDSDKESLKRVGSTTTRNYSNYATIPRSFQEFEQAQQLHPTLAAMEQRLHSHLDQVQDTLNNQIHLRNTEIDKRLRQLNAELTENIERLWMRVKYLEQSTDKLSSKLSDLISSKVDDMSRQIGVTNLESDLNHMRLFNGRLRSSMEDHFKRVHNDLETIQNEVTGAVVDASLHVAGQQLNKMREQLVRSVSDMDTIARLSEGVKELSVAAEPSPMDWAPPTARNPFLPRRANSSHPQQHPQSTSEALTPSNSNFPNLSIHRRRHHERANSTGSVEGRAGSGVMSEEQGRPLRRKRSFHDARMQAGALSPTGEARAQGFGSGPGNALPAERRGIPLMPLVAGMDGLAYEAPSDELLGVEYHTPPQ